MLKDEIWGCTHYMNIALETVMILPVEDRRYFIQKHNEEQYGIRSAIDRRRGNTTYDGEALNEYAKIEQQNIKNRKGGY